jgi:Ethanolamine utilization protein EutJ (predicted chaperonin)
MEDPEPVMQQLVRVFIDEGTFCPGFQFLAGGQLHPTVVALFKRAMELKIPHNYFTVWMVTPLGILDGSRPVDLLDGGPQPLLRALETLGKEQAPAAC